MRVVVRFALAAAFAAAATARVVVVISADLPDRLVDDAYIAFDVARTLGTSGHLPTSGVQPLYVLLIAPIYAFLRPESVAELDAAARMAVAVGAIVDFVGMALLVRLLWRAGGPTAAIVGAWAWALHPGAIAFSTNGLETSTAIASTVGVLLVAERWQSSYAREGGFLHPYALGAAVGLGMIARVDLAGLGAAAAIAVFWEARSSRRVPLPELARLGCGWAAVYLPWVAFLYWQTGDVLPVSGPATHLIGREHRTLYNAFGGPDYSLFMLANGVVELLFRAPLFALAALLLAPSVDWRRWRLLVLQSALVFVFYVGIHDVFYYLYRYLAPLLVLEVVSVSLGAASLAARWSRTDGARSKAHWARTVTAVLAFAVLLGVRHRVTLPETPDESAEYRQAALAYRDTLPPGMVVAAPESGALSYYLPGRVVNADGVCNREAYVAGRDGRLAEFLTERGVTRFIAGGPLSELVLLRTREPRWRRLLEVQRGKFALYRLERDNLSETASGP
jgi:hypothetical protein